MKEMTWRSVDLDEAIQDAYTHCTCLNSCWPVFRMGPNRICKWKWAEPLVRYLYVAIDADCAVYGL